MELDPGYGTDAYGLTPDFSMSEITFSAPYPDPASLSDAEKYMIMGCGKGAPGYLRSPWFQDVYVAATAGYSKDGKIPAVLTEELVRSLAQDPIGISQEWVDHFKSPLTGEFPRLDAASFSPGNLYIRVLSEAEKQHLAGLLPDYQRHWYEGEVQNPFTGDWVPGHLNGEVFYIRVYGNQNVIEESIQYDMQPDQPFAR